jgi:hypothetical protein
MGMTGTKQEQAEFEARGWDEGLVAGLLRVHTDAVDDPENYVVAEEMKSAMMNWFYYGFDPGSLGCNLIKRDWEWAYKSAHPRIKEHIEDHIEYTQRLLPEQAKDLDNWKGYNNLTKKEKKEVEFTPMMNRLLLDEIN